MTPGTGAGTAEAAELPRRLAVVGLGLMGGSLARGLGLLDAPPALAGWDASPAEAEAALRAGVLDRVSGSLEQAVEGADLVVLATPLGALLELLPRLAEAVSEGTCVTDVASLKAPVVRRAREVGLDGRFVGGHPMTGSERSGFAASHAGMYRGATVFLTSDTGGPEAREAVARLWRAVGGVPREVAAEAHDARMVRTSHLPQLTATALASLLADAGVAPAELGPGGRDMTRLAASSPRLWGDLLAHAGPEAAGLLRDLAGRLEALAAPLEAGRTEELERRMAITGAWRRGNSAVRREATAS